jgi:hypothetical protein
VSKASECKHNRQAVSRAVALNVVCADCQETLPVESDSRGALVKIRDDGKRRVLEFGATADRRLRGCMAFSASLPRGACVRRFRHDGEHRFARIDQLIAVETRP